MLPTGRPVTRWFSLGLTGLAIIVALSLLAVIVWALPRGFDSTDEAWLYTMLTNNRITVGEAWGFQHVLHPFFDLTGQSILAFRWVRLVGYLLLSGVLILIARSIGTRFRWTMGWPQWAMVIAISQVGTFLAWSYPPRYLSYNELSGWLVQIGAALLALSALFPVSQSTLRNNRGMWGIWVGAGAIFVALWAVKVSSGAMFLVLVAIVVLVRGGGFTLSRRLIAFAIGAGLAVAGLAALQFPFVGYARNLVSLVFDPAVNANYSHPVGQLVATYMRSLRDTATVILPSVSLFLAFVGIIFVRLTRSRSDAVGRLFGLVAVLTGILVCVAILAWESAPPFSRVGFLAVFLGVAAAIVFITTIYVRGATAETPRVANSQLVAACLAVLAAPFVAAVGTDNPIAGQLLYSSTIWAVALSVGMVVVSERLARNGSPLTIMPALFLVCLLGISALNVRGDVAIHPYRTVPYASQQTPTRAEHFAGMLLTQEQAEWSDWIAATAAELHAGQVATVSLNSPGALLAFNASPFVSPWVRDSWPVSIASVARACETEPKPRELLVLQPGTAPLDGGIAHEFAAALAQCGINFPADFDVVATRSSDDPSYSLRVWRFSA